VRKYNFRRKLYNKKYNFRKKIYIFATKNISVGAEIFLNLGEAEYLNN